MITVRNGFASASSASKVLALLLALVFGLALKPALAEPAQEYLLGPGDVLKVSVFKNPDLTLEVRVSETGAIGFPLIGPVQVANLTLPAAERKIAQLLKDGGFVQNAQVNILVTTEVSNQVSVLGQVNRPGRYPLELAGGHLAGILATAGGIAPTGSDSVIVSGMRSGKPFRHEIDTVQMSLSSDNHDDIALLGGDTVFVNRAPSFYIYGQVQRAGELRLEREMTVMQALASGGGITGKGTSRGIVIHRRDAGGKVKEISAALDDDVRDGDVIYVKESVF
jgi:polysaccharide export outer membrane protein